MARVATPRIAKFIAQELDSWVFRLLTRSIYQCLGVWEVARNAANDIVASLFTRFCLCVCLLANWRPLGWLRVVCDGDFVALDVAFAFGEVGILFSAQSLGVW